MINAGIGASIKHAAAKSRKPGPYPSLSVSGADVRGTKVPAKHRVTSTAVNADAEYSSKASVTYVSIGTMAVTIAVPIKTTANKSVQTGQCNPGA